VAVLLAVIAVLLTFFPPPSLPLRYLPGAAALILASMLTWHLRQGFHMDRHRQTVRVGRKQGRSVGEVAESQVAKQGFFQRPNRQMGP